MIWLNAWAWIGLAAVAVPVLVHLLARRQARPLPFPTLRFLGAPRTVLARRDRLSDIALLVVRIGIVTAAVAALAQPHVLTPERRETLDATLARAIIVDASPSMARSSTAGGTALEVARREAQRLAAETPAISVRESTSIAREIEGQRAWLNTQSGRRELVVISDFQTGAISAADLVALPTSVGIRLVPVAVAPDSRPLELTSTFGDIEATARMTIAPSDTTVEWTTRQRATAATGSGPTLLTGDAERPRAEAALEAARAAGAPSLGADHPVAIVFPGLTERALLIKEAAPLTDPWMFEAVARLRSDATLQYAARTTMAGSVRGAFPPLTTVVNDRNGEPLIAAASGRADGRNRLLLMSSADAGSLASAALIAGVQRALSTPATPEELDPTTVPSETLRGWERAPGSIEVQSRSDDRRQSDGRWFWMAALALLGLETWMRGRTNSAQQTAEVDHARVA
jgi:hypothetical protein